MDVRALVFGKKQGAELAIAAPFVNEVYAGTYPNTAPPPGLRSRALGKFGHFTYHSIPYSTGWLCATAYAVLWMLYPRRFKIISFLASFAFSLFESAITMIDPGRAYTSLAQFAANLIYVPVLLFVYGHFFGTSMALYVALFPLNIWLLELVQEHLILRVIFGHNVAWCYYDRNDCFGGCMRLGHAPVWIFVGVVCWHAQPLFSTIAAQWPD
jgi:hypothetical protein